MLQGAIGNQDKITPLVTIVPALIAKSASLANPIIYAISHPKYRLVNLLIIYKIWDAPYSTGFNSNRPCKLLFRGSASMNQNHQHLMVEEPEIPSRWPRSRPHQPTRLKYKISVMNIIEKGTEDCITL